jgi:PAS domain S-box-containing protein
VTKNKNEHEKSDLRKKAEMLLASKPRRSKAAVANQDALIYELEVHQIELEMQNDELRQSQAILENSYARITELYDLAPVGYVTIGIKGEIIEANLTASELLGYERQLLIGKPFSAFVNRDDQDIFYMHKQALRTVSSQTCELRLSKKNASTFYAQLVSVAVVENAKPTEEFKTAIFDISERIQAQHKLAEQKALLDAIIESSDSPIYAVDCDYRYICFNSQHAEMMKSLFGAQIEIGHSVLDYNTDPDDHTLIKKGLDLAISGEPFSMELFSGEKFRPRRYYVISYNTVRSRQGEVIGAAVYVRDLTERKHMEDDLQSYTNELLIANKELESFSYSISHDLRAPLRAMKGFSDMLLVDYSEKLDTQAQEYIKRIINSSVKMSELIDDILSLSKVSRQEIVPQEINLSTIAETVVNVLHQGDPANKVEVVIEPDIKALGDARLMGIALSNLISNAWKYSSKTSDARIEFGTMKKDGQKVYYVRDNGAGFNMAYVERLFEPFRRLHTDREFPGTGIGLAIVKRVIQKHKGAIWAESETGKGATFYFTLLLEI